MGLMWYYDRIDLSERIDPAKSNNSKEIIVCCYWLKIMGSNFKILFEIAVTIWRCCVLILAILLLSLLKVLIIVVLFITLANLKEFICWKIFCFMIIGMYKMHIKEINTGNRVYIYHFDNLIKAKKIETKNT